MGSHTDIPRVEAVKTYLNKKGIMVLEWIKSMHRNATVLREFAEPLPYLPEGIEDEIKKVSSKIEPLISVAICAAWWAAHLAGWVVAFSPGTVVIALPLDSSVAWKIDSIQAMLNMPPEVPNGLAYTPLIAWKMAEKIIKLNLPNGYNKLSVPKGRVKDIPQALLDSLWIEIDFDSPIKIVLSPLVPWWEISKSESDIHIAIPLLYREFQADEVGIQMNRLNQETLWMWQQIEGKVNFTNALIYGTQILATKNPILKEKLIERREEIGLEARKKDDVLQERQKHTFKETVQFLTSWLWPEDKSLDFSNGDTELETLWYTKLYSGKNADVYKVPDTQPIQILMIRTDKTSVFNIPLDLKIEGKGSIQNQISILW
jgi:phosphoribosylcarboxyaminoimidazole (NCAIR) mutase